MKITFNDRYSTVSTYELVKYVTTGLNGDDYENGAVETAQATADKCSEAIGRLLELLAIRKVIGSSDIVYIVEGFRRDNAELVEEAP
jgi:hypothetical protein